MDSLGCLYRSLDLKGLYEFVRLPSTLRVVRSFGILSSNPEIAEHYDAEAICASIETGNRFTFSSCVIKI